MSSKTFMARISVGEDVEQIEVWCHELDPVDRDKHRSTEEWVHEHLNECCQRDFFAELVPEEFRKGNFQVLIKGEINSYFDNYYGEYDEDVCIEESSHQVLPENWFSKQE